MMRLDRLAACVATVAEDGTSDLADLAAARWGHPAGAARYVRTSATCVFAVPDGYLRLRSVLDGPDPAPAVRVTAALADVDAPVTAPLPSLGGRLLERVAHPLLGTVTASAVAAAGAVEDELTDLTTEQVHAWGTALAGLHAAGHAVDPTGLPQSPVVGEAPEPSIRGQAERWSAELRERLGPPTTVVHGDPQPDNVGWSPAGPVFFDLDDLAVGWPVVDLVFAVRDAAPLTELTVPVTDSDAGRALVTAYAEASGHRALDPETAILVQRVAAAATYGRVVVALSGPPTADPPEWLIALRTRLTTLATNLRVALLEVG